MHLIRNALAAAAEAAGASVAQIFLAVRASGSGNCGEVAIARTIASMILFILVILLCCSLLALTRTSARPACAGCLHVCHMRVRAMVK